MASTGTTRVTQCRCTSSTMNSPSLISRRRLVSGDEDALFAAYLASDAAACFVGQVFPVCGGWVG